MRNFKLLSVFMLASLLSMSCTQEDLQSSTTEGESVSLIKENNTLTARVDDTPNGSHYNLNIIGVPNGKTADMTGNNGGRIFVSLTGSSKIMLKEGPDFSVLDANGTDGSASFQLPNPDPDGDGKSLYSIYARALGTPGGSAIITTCADADLTDDGYYEVCSADALTVTRSKGAAPKFTNVSSELLTIYIPNEITLPDGSKIKAGRYTIFDDRLEGYFWQYDNTGLKLLQLRFYPTSTDINLPPS